MINPIVNAFEFFLALYNSLPYAVSAFIDIALVLLVVVAVIHIFKG